MTQEQIFNEIQQKKSFACIGLDTDKSKMPEHLKGDMFAFNKAIIDATAPYCVAYKPNLAFYESEGLYGWNVLESTAFYIKENYPEIFLIADAKRGDIGNTSEMYAKTFLQNLPFDAMTLAPYMGEDSVKPFLKFDGKYAILLALTSNKGAKDFQMLKTESEYSYLGASIPLYQKVLKTSKEWGSEENMMYVVGATQASMLKNIREIVPNHFLLVPGVGAQGGSLKEVAEYGMNDRCGLLVNSSRAIIYASKGEDFAEAAAAEAKKLQEEMSLYLEEKGLVI